MAEEVRVFGVWGSPFSRRIEIALKLKGVEYEYIEEDLANKSDLLLKYNPVHKKVPVLLHNGKSICESLIGVEYIDETWKGTPLLPQDPYERAMARFWAKFIDDKCMEASWKACFSKGEEHEKAMEEAITLLKFLDNELEGKKFFGGKNIGLVDLSASFVSFWVGVFEEITGVKLLTKEKLPNLCGWIDEFLNHSIIKENLPPKDKLIAFFKVGVLPSTAPKIAD